MLTGEPVTLRVACKPAISILIPVGTVTREGNASEIITKGRHDSCVGIRGVPVVEAMMALVLADQKLLHRAQCGWFRCLRLWFFWILPLMILFVPGMEIGRAECRERVGQYV